MINDKWLFVFDCIIILGKELSSRQKYEIRISKSETNSNYQNINVQNTGFFARKCVFLVINTPKMFKTLAFMMQNNASLRVSADTKTCGSPLYLRPPTGKGASCWRFPSTGSGQATFACWQTYWYFNRFPNKCKENKKKYSPLRTRRIQ